MTSETKHLNDAHTRARIAELYDLNPAYSKRKDAAFYLDVAKSSGGPVLELGCGTGRVLLDIAREGVTVTGIDRSRPMLEILEKKLALEPAEVQRPVAVSYTHLTLPTN